MMKKLYSYLMMFSASALFMIACSEDEDKITHFTSNVDVKDSRFSADKYSMTLKFSTDGTTFVDFPKVKLGESYWVKVYNTHAESDATLTECFNVDWSGSTPAPATQSNGLAQFVMKEINDLKAVVVTPPYEAGVWGGTYSAIEDYHSNGTYGPYDTNVAPDLTNDHRFVLTNFYDSNLSAYILFDPATYSVKFPTQTTGGKSITASSGTYDQCKKTIHLVLNYDGSTWDYYLTKK